MLTASSRELACPRLEPPKPDNADMDAGMYQAASAESGRGRYWSSAAACNGGANGLGKQGLCHRDQWALPFPGRAFPVWTLQNGAAIGSASWATPLPPVLLILNPLTAPMSLASSAGCVGISGACGFGLVSLGMGVSFCQLSPSQFGKAGLTSCPFLAGRDGEERAGVGSVLFPQNWGLGGLFTLSRSEAHRPECRCRAPSCL